MHFKYLSSDRTTSNYSNYTDRVLDNIFDLQRKELMLIKDEVVHQFEKIFENAWVLQLYTKRSIALNSCKGLCANSHMYNSWRGVYLDDGNLNVNAIVLTYEYQVSVSFSELEKEKEKKDLEQK